MQWMMMLWGKEMELRLQIISNIFIIKFLIFCMIFSMDGWLFFMFRNVFINVAHITHEYIDNNDNNMCDINGTDLPYMYKLHNPYKIHPWQWWQLFFEFINRLSSSKIINNIFIFHRKYKNESPSLIFMDALLHAESSAPMICA